MKKIILAAVLAFVIVLPIKWIDGCRETPYYWFSFGLSVLLLAYRYLQLSKEISKYDFLAIDDITPQSQSPVLFTINGCGTRFVGFFRQQEEFYVTYQFFCILFVPIIPINCYLVSDVGDNKSYKVYGKVPRSSDETAAIYLSWYSWIGFALSLICAFC